MNLVAPPRNQRSDIPQLSHPPSRCIHQDICDHWLKFEHRFQQRFFWLSLPDVTSQSTSTYQLAGSNQDADHELRYYPTRCVVVHAYQPHTGRRQRQRDVHPGHHPT